MWDSTIYYAKPFSYVSILDLFDDIKPSVVCLNPPDDLFTKRELEIIIYAIRKLSAK